jgi:hypothetical protein
MPVHRRQEAALPTFPSAFLHSARCHRSSLRILQVSAQVLEDLALALLDFEKDRLRQADVGFEPPRHREGSIAARRIQALARAAQ